MVVDDESSTYWPILRNWSFMGSRLTEVNAAAQLKPTLALVWLGANDVLKYMGSGGLFHGGDVTPGQAAADERQAINTLKRAGAHVVAANLPNILETAYFQRVTHRTAVFKRLLEQLSDLRRLPLRDRASVTVPHSGRAYDANREILQPRNAGRLYAGDHECPMRLLNAARHARDRRLLPHARQASGSRQRKTGKRIRQLLHYAAVRGEGSSTQRRRQRTG